MNFKMLNPDNIDLTMLRLARKVVIITGLFALIMSVLMIANYIQIKSVEPLKSPALSQLRLQLQKDPENTVLKEQIRALDLLARKAYFANQWQVRSGGFLLFTAILILLLALKYINSQRSKLPDLRSLPDPQLSWTDIILARKYIIVSALVLFTSAVIISIISDSEITTLGLGSAEQAEYPRPENRYPQSGL
jgi:outer membrane protein assembly factor BamB